MLKSCFILKPCQPNPWVVISRNSNGAVFHPQPCHPPPQCQLWPSFNTTGSWFLGLKHQKIHCLLFSWGSFLAVWCSESVHYVVRWGYMPAQGIGTIRRLWFGKWVGSPWSGAVISTFICLAENYWSHTVNMGEVLSGQWHSSYKTSVWKWEQAFVLCDDKTTKGRGGEEGWEHHSSIIWFLD